MVFSVEPEAPPLREDGSGAVRVGDSRVLLELVVHAFRDGATPEMIVQRYPSLALSDVYAVIAYCLRHPAETKSYLSRREQEAEEIREQVTAHQRDLRDIRDRILAHRQR